jgi:hypothetical protein
MNMKKDNLKIFAICFIIVYVLTAGLSILNRQPLVFTLDYSIGQFILLFILMGFLSFSLVFVMENLEKLLKKYLSSVFISPPSIYAYFVLVSTFGLFVFTLFSGYAESGRPFLYYGCVTNSCIYLINGYSVTLITAVYFAYRFVKNLSSKSVT